MAEDLIQMKFREMMDIFRVEFARLSPNEKKHEQQISSLREPCQVHLLSSPDGRQHLVILTHFRELPDKYVELISLSETKFIEQLEEFSEKPMWRTEVTEDANSGISSVSTIGMISQTLVSFGKLIASGYRESSAQEGVHGMSLINSNCAVWNIYGDITKIDLGAKARDIVKDYKASYEQSEKEKSKPLEQIKEAIPDKIQGCGTYCYPPILIGHFDPSLKDRILNREYESLSENVLIGDFDGIPLVVNRAGLIGLETQNAILAKDIFNVIAGAAVCLGLPLHSIKSSEIAKITFDRTNHRAVGFSYSASSVRMMQFQYSRSFNGYPSYMVRNQMELHDIELIIKTAKQIWIQKDQRNIIRLILNAFTHLNNDEFSQSFIMSWSIIESYIYNLWNDKLQSAGSTKKKKGRLEKWEVSRIVEVLHLDQILNDDDYYEFSHLRSLRNDIIHEGYEVTKRQAEECYELANKITSKECGITSTIQIVRTLSP